MVSAENRVRTGGRGRQSSHSQALSGRDRAKIKGLLDIGMSSLNPASKIRRRLGEQRSIDEFGESTALALRGLSR
jgi:hypothetical protein